MVVNVKMETYQPQSNTDWILKASSVSRTVYENLNSREMELFSLYTKWQVKLQGSLSYKEFLQCFRNIYQITNYGKLRSFQFRLLHRAVTLNEKLKMWKVIENGNCSECEGESETLEHFFWSCIHAQTWWNQVKIVCHKYRKEKITISLEAILLNKVNCKPNHIHNFIILAAKQYMYTQRCLKSRREIKQFGNQIKLYQSYELYNAKKKCKTSKHYKKWYNVSEKVEEFHADSFTHEYVVNMMLYDTNTR